MNKILITITICLALSAGRSIEYTQTYDQNKAMQTELTELRQFKNEVDLMANNMVAMNLPITRRN